MQPYFLPYIGYWQLLNAVDRFVVYDNIQYTKQTWINRNRFLRNGSDTFFTLPLKKASDFAQVVERSLADDFDPKTLLNPLAEAYRKAPCFEQTFPLLERIFSAAAAPNLFDFLLHSITTVADHLGIRTPVVVSSTIPIDHALKAEQKVLAICEALGASRYINSIGGKDLYSREAFAARGIELQFLQARPIEYPQFAHPFVPALSIVDVLMFNPVPVVRGMLTEYDLA